MDMSPNTKWPILGHARRNASNWLIDSSVPNVAGTEKRNDTAQRPRKFARPRSNCAVSSFAPSMRMPAKTSTRNLLGRRLTCKHASKGRARTTNRSCREKRCSQKSRCLTTKHSSAGRPASGSCNGCVRLPGPINDARQILKCWPQAASTVVRRSAERRSWRTSSCKGALATSRDPSCVKRGTTTCHRCKDCAERSGGNETDNARKDESSCLCCFDKAVSIVTQPSRSRSTAIDSTAAHWSFLAMPSATPGFTVSRTFLTWCTTVRPYNAQCCAMTAGEACNHLSDSPAARNGNTDSATRRPNGEAAKVRRSRSRAMRRRRSSLQRHFSFRSAICFPMSSKLRRSSTSTCANSLSAKLSKACLEEHAASNTSAMAACETIAGGARLTCRVCAKRAPEQTCSPATPGI
mmetsp:Transcript_20618/g.58462  ORF Transcript_20618/g.58462 Transcript_20618/m.58462 type:complete len:407 (-) Transcript_20618:33-1253(-)